MTRTYWIFQSGTHGIALHAGLKFPWICPRANDFSSTWVLTFSMIQISNDLLSGAASVFVLRRCACCTLKRVKVLQRRQRFILTAQLAQRRSTFHMVWQRNLQHRRRARMYRFPVHSVQTRRTLQFGPTMRRLTSSKSTLWLT